MKNLKVISALAVTVSSTALFVAVASPAFAQTARRKVRPLQRQLVQMRLSSPARAGPTEPWRTARFLLTSFRRKLC